MQTELLTPLLYCYGSKTPSVNGTWEVVEDSPEEAQYCRHCGEAKTHYRQHRPGKKPLNKSRCIPCHNKRIGEFNRKRKDRQGRTATGQAIVDQRGLPVEEQQRLNRERVRRRKYLEHKGWSSYTRRTYGLDLEAYWELLEKQGHKCAIDGCEFEHRPEAYWEEVGQYTGSGLRKGDTHQHAYLLNVDHCHNGGHVRGLLCNRCNVAVGHVEETRRRGIKPRALMRFLDAA